MLQTGGGDIRSASLTLRSNPPELFDFGCVLDKETQQATNIVEEGFLGVFAVFLVQGLLENAHPGRHQQSEGQHGNACRKQVVISEERLGKDEITLDDKEEPKLLVQIMTTNRRSFSSGLLINSAG